MVEIEGDALHALMRNNRAWSESRRAADPEFFERLCAVQNPDYLWVGCSDSRVPANEIVGLEPGELFVHRNVANLVVADDPNSMSVLQFAIDALQVEHVIVCGHYGCGGVLAALEGLPGGALSDWLEPVVRIAQEHNDELDELDPGARARRLCELNVVEQVRRVEDAPSVQKARDRGQGLAVHGWIYDLHDGLLRQLVTPVVAPGKNQTWGDDRFS